MRFLSKSNLLKNDSVLLVANIYSDKISMFVVERKKDGGAVSILASTIEPQEGNIKQGNELDADKIILNLQKAMQAIPPEIMRAAKKAVFGFGDDISDFEFRQLKLERRDKDKKISEEESESLMKNKQDEELSVEKLIANIESLSANRGMEALGFINLTQSALQALKDSDDPSVGKDFIFISVFQNNTDVIVARDNVINSIGNLGAGYGIIEKSVSEKFEVGIEEAKDIISKMRSGELNSESDDSAKLAVQHALSAHIEKIRELFGNIDKMLILPGTIIIGISEESPELLKVLLDKIWLADLPLERNAEINNLNVLIGGQEELNNVFDLAILKFIK